MSSLDKGNGFGFSTEEPTCYWGTPDSWHRRKKLFQIEVTTVLLALAEFHRQDDNGVAVSDWLYRDLRHYLIGSSEDGVAKWYCYLGDGHHAPFPINLEGGEIIVLSKDRKDKLTRIDVTLSRALEEPPTYEQNCFADTCSLVIPDFEQINQELVTYFARHPDELYELAPNKFEQLLEAIFRHLGYETELCAGPGDLGVDLRLTNKDSIGPIVTLVQAKRYHPKNPIRLDAVQALYGAVESEKATRGLFVTTSRYLPGVMKFADQNWRRLALADAKQVARWCDAIRRSVSGK